MLLLVSVFVVAFILGALVALYVRKKNTGGRASGYDQQAYNGDANSALMYLNENDEESARRMLNRIIKRTGMGKRDNL